MAQSISLFPMMSLTPSVMSQYLSGHVLHILSGTLTEVQVPLCAPHGVQEHLKDVHLQFLDLTKIGKISILAHFLMS
jgi:hypothetical protein